MKKLVSSPDAAELELLRNMLANAGIACEARNRDVSGVFPAPPFYEELWVADEDHASASELLASWQRPPKADAWICPRCKERIDPQFSSCWKCGAQRPVATT